MPSQTVSSPNSKPLNSGQASYSYHDLTEDQLIAAQTVECPDVAEAEYALSFDLHNFRQPDASRNLLVLIRLGFFDDKQVFYYENSDAMPAIGNPSAAADPFFYPPDSKYTEATPELNNDHFSNNAVDLTKVSIFYKEQVQAQIPSSIRADMLMAAVENPFSADLARRMLPFRAIFSNFIYAAQEDILGKVKAKTFPVPYGTLVTPFPGKSLSRVRQLLAPMRRNKTLKVACIAIEPLPLTNFDSKELRCPEVLGL
jgi:hypothetical protein